MRSPLFFLIILRWFLMITEVSFKCPEYICFSLFKHLARIKLALLFYCLSALPSSLMWKLEYWPFYGLWARTHICFCFSQSLILVALWLYLLLPVTWRWFVRVAFWKSLTPYRAFISSLPTPTHSIQLRNQWGFNHYHMRRSLSPIST